MRTTILCGMAKVPGEPSSDCPNYVSDLLESVARVSLSDLFGDVTDEGASECGDPAVL